MGMLDRLAGRGSVQVGQAGGIGPLAGLEYMRMRGEEGRQRGQGELLNRLAGHAYNAQPSERGTVYGQMAQVNPQAALETEQGLTQRDAERAIALGAKARYLLNMHRAGQQQAVAGAYADLAQTARALNLWNVPDQWDESFLPGMEALAKAGQDQQQSAPSQFTALDMQARAAGYEPGSDGYRDFFRRANGEIARQSSAAIGYEKVTGPDGRDYLVATDPRAVGAQVIGGGGSYGSGVSGPAPAIPNVAGTPAQGDVAADAGDGFYQQMIAAGLSDEQATAATGVYLTNFEREGGAAKPPQAAAQPEPGREPRVVDPINGGFLPQPGPNPFASQTPAEKAFGAEAGKAAAQLQFAPQVAAAEAEAARLKALAQAQAERDVEAPKRMKQYEQALQAAGNVEASIDKALGMVGSTSTGFFGARSRSIEGTPAYNLAAELETVKANLGFDRLQQMRDNSPTGGALGAIAVQELVALQSTIANLDPNQSAEQISANLSRVRQHYANWRSAVQQAMADERRQGSNAAAPAPAPASAAGGWGIQRVN